MHFLVFDSMCILNITHFLSLQIYCEVIPKRQALSQANAELETATTKLLAVQKKLEVSAANIIFI